MNFFLRWCTDQHFARTGDGRLLYRAADRRRDYFLVPSDEVELSIRRNLGRWYVLMFSTIAGLSLTGKMVARLLEVNDWIVFPFVMGIALVVLLGARKVILGDLCNGLARVDLPAISRRAMLSDQAQRMPESLLASLLLGSLLFVVAAIVLLIRDATDASAWLGLGFFGLCLGYAIVLARLKLQSQGAEHR